MPGYCPASLRRLLLVKNIPLQAERHSGEPQKLFAFPPESVDRNAVRIHNGIVFAFRSESRSPSTGPQYLRHARSRQEYLLAVQF